MFLHTLHGIIAISTGVNVWDCGFDLILDMDNPLLLITLAVIHSADLLGTVRSLLMRRTIDLLSP